MRYLAILLLAPLLLVLCGIYWAYPRSLPRTWWRRSFDIVALLLILVVSATCAVIGFDAVGAPATDEFGRISSGIWQQVLPALYGYGAFSVMLALATLLRHLIWARRR